VKGCQGHQHGPRNEKWTWGAGQSIYAESPDRIYLIFPRRLLQYQAAGDQAAARVRPSVQVPDWTSAVFAMRTCLASGGLLGALGGHRPLARDLERTHEAVDRSTARAWMREMGKLCITVVDHNGNILERWTQWDKIRESGRISSAVVLGVTVVDRVKSMSGWFDGSTCSESTITHDGQQLCRTIWHGRSVEGSRRHAVSTGPDLDSPGFPTCTDVCAPTAKNGTRVANSTRRKIPDGLGPEGPRIPNEKRPYYMKQMCTASAGRSGDSTASLSMIAAIIACRCS